MDIRIKINKDIVISRILYRFIIVVTLFCLSANSYCMSMSVISHSSVDVTSLTTSQLRRIYSMRQVRWPNNTPIIVFSLASKHTLHQRFTKENLRLFPYQLDRIWNKLTFSGLGVAPTIMKNQQELLHAVINTPGAIGYIENTKDIDNVNIIKIDD